MHKAKVLIRCMNLAAYTLMALILFNVVQKFTWARAFNFNFSWLSGVYLAAILVAAALLFLIRRVNSTNRTLFWFKIYIIAVAAFMMANLLKGASADIPVYEFWYSLLDFTGFIIAPLFTMFVMHYVNRQDLLYRPITWLAILGMTFLIIPMTSNGAYINGSVEIVRMSYGFPNTASLSTAGVYSVLLLTTILLAGLILLVLHYNQVKTIASQRTQVKLLIFGGTVPLTLGFIAAGILPLFDVHLPAEPFFSIVQIIILGYAILHYKLFNIDPAALADTILATMNESVVTINVNKEIEFLNPAAQRFLGIKQSTARGRQITALFDESTSNSILARLVPHRNVSESIEFITHVHGHRVPISLAVSKITSNGSVEGFILIFRDVSVEHAIKREIEREVVKRTSELNNEHARLQAAMDSLEVGLLMTFKDGKTITHNTILPEILGWDETAPTDKPAELTLDWLEDKLLASKLDLMASIAHCQKTGKSFEVKEVTYGNKILRIFGAPILIDGGDAIGAIVLLDDITEAKIVERSKDEFFSIASHELRTPLTSIKGNTSMILQYYPDVLKDKALKEMVDDIHESSVRLIAIVNDFLDVSRLEQSKSMFDFETISVEEVIESVAYEIQAVMREKKLYLKLDKIVLDKLPKICADKNRLKQVIYNLLGNAMKFTEEGGITLSAEVEGDMIRVMVTDTGRGMTADSQKLLFHKFQQASSSLLTRDTTRGTGLGLYISKMIVENMGGAILLVESKEGVGTTFAFTVPIATPKRIAAEHKVAAHTDVKTGLTTRKV